LECRLEACGPGVPADIIVLGTAHREGAYIAWKSAGIYRDRGHPART